MKKRLAKNEERTCGTVNQTASNFSNGGKKCEFVEHMVSEIFN